MKYNVPLTTHHSLPDHITHKHLRLVDRHIRIADQRRQVVDHVALTDTLVAPVPGEADVVDQFVLQLIWPDAAGHERFGADGAARRRDAYPFGIAYADLLGMLGRNLAEQFRLQLR